MLASGTGFVLALSGQLNNPTVEYTMSSSKPKTPMTPDAAKRIQRNADRTGTNSDFKERAQRAADKNTNAAKGPQSKKR